MAVAALEDRNVSTELAMNTTPASPGNLDNSPAAAPAARPVQTGALAGGQPGQGVNTSSSKAGQSNVDAAAAQGTEYGKNQPPKG